MDTVTLITFASVAAAVLFFLSGYAARAGRSAPPLPLVSEPIDLADIAIEPPRLKASPATPTVDAEVEAARVQAQRAAQEASALRSRLSELEHAEREREAAKAQAHRAAQEASALRSRLSELEHAASESEAAKAQAHRAAQEASALRSRLSGLEQAEKESEAAKAQAHRAAQETQTRLAELERLLEIRAFDAERLAAAEKAARQGDLVRAQVAQLKQELEARGRRLESAEGELEQLRHKAEDFDASLEAAEEVEVLRVQQRELMLRSRLQQQKLEELEQYAQENAELRQRILDHDAVLAERDALRERMHEVEAQVFAATRDPSPSATPLGGTGSDGALGVALEQVLQEAVRTGQAHAAVVADASGLLLAAAGERTHQEPLAVVSGLVAQLGTSTQTDLPVGELRGAELLDVNGVGVACRFVRQEGQAPLAVTVLRRQSRTTEASLEEMAVAVERALSRGD